MTHFLARLNIIIGVGFLASAIGIVILTYIPIAGHELAYALKPSSTPKTPTMPANTQFGIVIDKIGANAAVVAQVDPFNPAAYQEALTKGVAHAKDTALPTEPGNMFLFSHSSVDFLQASRYNSIFYLLSKLTQGDTITVYYHDTRYTYTVTGIKQVEASEIQYLQQFSPEKTLTLMTCWPPGTDLKRLLVFAKQTP